MPAALTDPAHKYLRRLCGLPPILAAMQPGDDPDDPAGRLLTTAEAAEAAHVPEATIRDWARRKLLLPSGQQDGHPLYRELDVLRVEARTRRAAREQRLAAEAMDGLSIAAT